MKARIKMRQLPGDISKRRKIAILEGRAPAADQWRIKSFKKTRRARERAVLAARTRRDLDDT